MRARHTAFRPLAALTLAALAGIALTGCGGDAQAELALQEAEATLAALHDGGEAAPADFISSTHTSIRQKLSPALSASESSIQAAAQLVQGQTFVGDAELAAKNAETLEAVAADMLSEAQALAGRLYVWRHARADAAASYNPDASVQDVDATIVDAQRERTDLTQQRDEAQQRLDTLAQAVDAGTQEALALRTQEIELRDASLDLEGDERLAMIEQVYTAQRAADAAVQSTSDLEARVANLRPTLEGIERQITGQDRLIELLRATKQSLSERGDRSARTAQVDREQAGIAASRLEALLNELHDFRSSELETAYQASASAYRQAGTSLRSAGSGGASPLWLSGAQHAQGELSSARAASNIRYADFLDSLAAAEPRLPFAGDLTSRASDARTSAEGHQSDASSAYSSAASGYRRAARGPQAQKLRELADQLEARATGVEYDPAANDEG